MHFRTGGGRRQQGRQQQQQQQPNAAVFLQLIPMLVIILLTFFSGSDSGTGGMPGEGQYFSLKQTHFFHNPKRTQYSKVTNIPYYVSDNFLYTYNRDRYQRAKVENMVERAYEYSLQQGCQQQKQYKSRLFKT